MPNFADYLRGEVKNAIKEKRDRFKKWVISEMIDSAKEGYKGLIYDTRKLPEEYQVLISDGNISGTLECLIPKLPGCKVIFEGNVIHNDGSIRKYLMIGWKDEADESGDDE